MKVYLAGGMVNDWRSQIKRECKNITFYDPCDLGFMSPDRYTTYDMQSVKHCDVLFGYLEKSNPSGLGLATEIGCAYGLGKIIILMDEHNSRYSQIMRQCANVLCSTVEEGIEFLQRFNKLYE